MSKSLNEQRFGNKLLNLDEIFSEEWRTSLKNPTLSSDEWMTAFEKTEVSAEQAELIFKRMEASNKRFPI
jgi:hypothetical protein